MENGVLFAQIMNVLRKSVVSLVLIPQIKRTGKPFPLDPELSYFKDNMQVQTKTKNWKIVCKELRKFDIHMNQEKRQLATLGS